MPKLMKPNTAIAVANWFIDKNRSEPRGLTHSKIQTLLYFSQGMHLAIFSKPLFSGPIEIMPLFSDSTDAWKFGPAVFSVYIRLCRFSHEDNIVQLMKEHIAEDGACKLVAPTIMFYSEDSKDMLETFWEDCSGISTDVLVNASVTEDGPCARYRILAEDDSYDYPAIPLESIKAYFDSVLKKLNRYGGLACAMRDYVISIGRQGDSDGRSGWKRRA